MADSSPMKLLPEGTGSVLRDAADDVISPEAKPLIGRWQKFTDEQSARRVQEAAQAEAFKRGLPRADPGQGLMEFLEPSKDPAKRPGRGQYVQAPSNILQRIGEAVVGEGRTAVHPISGERTRLPGYQAETYFTGAQLDFIRNNPDLAMSQGLVNEEQLKVIMPTSEFMPLESLSPAQVLANATGMNFTEAEGALIVSGASAEKEEKNLPDDERTPLDGTTQGVDITDTESMRRAALRNLFGTGSPHGVHGIDAADTLSKLGAVKDRIGILGDQSFEASQTLTENADMIAAEQLRGKVAQRQYEKRKMHITADHESAYKRAYDKYYGPDGHVTKWEKTADDMIAKISVTSQIDESGPFGFSTWGDTLRTIGAVAALGGEVMAKYALGAANVPSIAMPMIMGAIESDMRRDERKAREARTEGTEYASVGDSFMRAFHNRGLAQDGYLKVGLATAKAKLDWIKSRLPKGAPGSVQRQKYLDNIKAAIIQKESDAEISRQKKVQDALLKTSAEYRNEGQAQRQADSSLTARGASQLNALTVLENQTKEPTLKSQFNNNDKQLLDAETKFLARGRRIKAVAARLIAKSGGDYGAIENALYMNFSEFTNKYFTQPDQRAEANLLNQLLTEQVTGFGKSFEDRLTDEDFKRYTKMLGTLENSNLINVLTRHEEAVYSIRESYLTRMARARKTGDWDLYVDTFEVGLSQDPQDALDRFTRSVKARTKMGDDGELRRLDVGQVPIDLVFEEGSRLSGMEAKKLEARLNDPIRGGFRSDFDDAAEYQRQLDEEREFRAKQSPVPGRIVLPGQKTSPSNSAKYRDERMDRSYGQILDIMKTTSDFGKRTHPVTGKKGRHHEGLDLKAAVGSPLASPSRARVTKVGEGAKSGKYVKIIDTWGFEWTFMHLDQIGVKIGQQVNGGELLGATGQTGRVTGPHLHMEIRDTRGKLVDPAVLMAQYMKKK